MNSAIDKHKKLWEDRGIEYGLCLCGCSQRTNISKRTDNAKNLLKGEPKQYVFGHTRNTNKSPPTYENRGYVTPCLIIRGYKRAKGYGMKYHEGRLWLYHVLVYVQAYGPVPEGHDVHHKCEQKDCVEPTHLQSLTRKEHHHIHIP